MTPFYVRTAFAVLLVLTFSGCDALNDAINDALPEVGIADGIFGLGPDGTEMQGSFGGGAGKAAAVGTFSLTKTFDDLDSGDISEVSSISSSIQMLLYSGNANIELERGEAARLPNSLTLTNLSLTWSLSDANTNLSGQISRGNTQVLLTRWEGCSATAASCPYSGNPLAGVLIGHFESAGAQAAQIFGMIAQSTPATPNTVQFTVTMTVSNSELEMAGIGARIRVGEIDTTVQPILF